MGNRGLLQSVLFGFLGSLLIAVPAFGTICRQEPVTEESPAGPLPEKQEVLEFEVFVSDSEGEPVKGATVKPWAIGSAQGHGMWTSKSTGIEPASATTDSSGKATIRYPKYANVAEEVKSNLITVAVDHPDYPHVGDVHIDMPRKKTKKIRLPLGSAVEVTVLLDGEPVIGETIKAIWSGGRSFSGDIGLDFDEEKKTVRIPPMAAGKGHFLFIRLDGDTITHFSPIQHLDIDGSVKVIEKEIALEPADTIRGKLSDNVPRPVINGRIKFQTITEGYSWDEVSWFDWAPVKEDGTFEVPAWPKGESMQLVAMCDGFIAKSGDPPPIIPEEEAVAGYWRPQTFLEPAGTDNVIEMESMSVCRIEVENAFGKKLEKVRAAANPNVGWWNGGSQIYCWPLVAGTDFLKTGKYDRDRKDGIYAQPFSGESDEDGLIVVELPVGEKTNLWIANERYQLPAKLGRRNMTTAVERNKSMKLDVVLQPIGLDVLGDWEDLCGLVFG